MIEILITVCLLNSPSHCKNVGLNFMADHVTPQQCMMYGQSEIAKWTEMNPKWKVAKWGCSRVNQKLGKA